MLWFAGKNNEPQINADENSQIKSPQRTQRTQRAQSVTVLAGYVEVLQQRYRTRMTRIRRIFTDMINPCVSASSVQSVFYRYYPASFVEKNLSAPRKFFSTCINSSVSAFICVHLRLIKLNEILEYNPKIIRILKYD